MSFDNYLYESIDEEISLDDFLTKIKSNGLYGYDVFKSISEKDLKSILEDDHYFDTTMTAKSNVKTISEAAVVGEEPDKPVNRMEQMKQKNLSLSVRLGLKKDEETKDTVDNHQFGKKPELNKRDTKEANNAVVKTYADRMRDEQIRRQKEREEKVEADNKIRDERLKKADDERKAKQEQDKLVFANKSEEEQAKKDQAAEDKINDDLDKKLTAAMFAKKTAKIVKSDDNYSRVKNLSDADDKESAGKLKKEMDDKFPEKSKTTPSRRIGSTEYSKRTLLAIADRMDFDVFCKYKKLNGQTRTGNFRIGKTESQRTLKTDTIICIDLDLTKSKDKPEWRTINLHKIISIAPI